LLGENLEAEKSLFRRKELFERMKIFAQLRIFVRVFRASAHSQRTAELLARRLP